MNVHMVHRHRPGTRPVPDPATVPIQPYTGPNATHDPRVSFYSTVAEMEKCLHAAGLYLDIHTGLFRQQ
jgi:hypothetical protein